MALLPINVFPWLCSGMAFKNRDETMRTRVNTDPHSPETFRINGPASNFDPFYAAFNVKEGDKMYLKPEERAKIW